MYCVFKSVL